LNHFFKSVLAVANFAAKQHHDVRIVIVLYQPLKQLHSLKNTLKAQRKAGVGNAIGLVCIASLSKTNLFEIFGNQFELRANVKTHQNQNGLRQRRHIRHRRVALLVLP
jgi:hypothetical protein